MCPLFHQFSFKQRFEAKKYKKQKILKNIIFFLVTNYDFEASNKEIRALQETSSSCMTDP